MAWKSFKLAFDLQLCWYPNTKGEIYGERFGKILNKGLRAGHDSRRNEKKILRENELSISLFWWK